MNKITQITQNILLGRSSINVEAICSSLNGVESFKKEEYDEVDSVIIGNKLKWVNIFYINYNRWWYDIVFGLSLWFSSRSALKWSVNFQFRPIFYLREGNSLYNGWKVKKKLSSSGHARAGTYIYISTHRRSWNIDNLWWKVTRSEGVASRQWRDKRRDVISRDDPTLLRYISPVWKRNKRARNMHIYEN